MTAIVAYAARAADPADAAWLEPATGISTKAGPDGHAYRRWARAGLGHALLRTDGERGGRLCLDGHTWIAAAVRLDDPGALAAGLRRAGMPAASADEHAAALLLRAYEVWGEGLVEHISGDFAFALFDGVNERLVCARDQLGVVPLHYVQQGEGLLVASVLEALLAHPRVSGELDGNAITDFLAFGLYTDPAATAFAAIRQLPPAHRLVWTPTEVRLERYPRLPPRPSLRSFARAQDAAGALTERLDEAVADRLGPRRVAVQLSGGMDSTSVAASAAATLRPRGGEVHAFALTLGADSGDREGELARQVARHLGVQIHVLDASHESPIDPRTQPAYLPEPLPYAYTGLTLHLAELQAQWSRVSLSGHGGDQLFGYVPWYWAEWVLQGSLSRTARALTAGARAHHRLRLGIRPAIRQARTRPDAAPRWLSAPRRPDRLAARLSSSDRDARGLVHSPLWASEFRHGDPSFTGLPVRFRFPLVDLRLIDFVRSLAPDPWLAGKRILRETATGRLPEEVRLRPKTPLGVRAPAGVTDDTLTALADMVMHCPELDRFVDRGTLRAELLAHGADASSERFARDRALGLAYWLWHRN